jgi:hypothetical protein
MFTRILVVSAAAVALTVPGAQAAGHGPLFPFIFNLCHFAQQSQCAINHARGDDNTALIDQEQWWPGLQLGVQIQHGDDNNAYTGQTGSNQFAFTEQHGNHNTAYTSQSGYNQASVTVQTGSQGGMWAATSSAGTDTLTVVVQHN